MPGKEHIPTRHNKIDILKGIKLKCNLKHSSKLPSMNEDAPQMVLRARNSLCYGLDDRGHQSFYRPSPTRYGTFRIPAQQFGNQ